METLMIPMFAAAAPAAKSAPAAPSRASGESNFAGHLDRQRGASERSGQDLLGVGRRPETRRNSADGSNGSASESIRNGEAGRSAQSARIADVQPVPNSRDEEQDFNALLAQFLGFIREETGNVANGPGQWDVVITDPARLTELAQKAGMGEAELAALMAQFEAKGGVFEMGEFLARFVRHFEGLQNEQPVTVPETDLPFIESILARLDVPMEEISRLGQQAVRGDNTVDLALLLQGLRELANQPNSVPQANPAAEGEVTLTGWDAEQLQGLLEAAGVSRETQRQLLPELHAPWDNPARPEQPVKIDLERLVNLLQRGLADVQANRLQPDVPAFLDDLKAIFAEAGFMEKGAGWSPAVQEAANKMFGKLMETVDPATVRIEKPTPATSRLGQQNTDETAEENLADLEQDAAPTLANETAGGNSGALLADDDAAFSGQHFLNEQAAADQDAAPALAAADRAADSGRIDPLERPQAGPRLTPQLEQQLFNRITDNVTRGLHRNEHHLVMRLYPKEMGEVKVEMLVRNNQVSLSFMMENSRVKEILEKNMEMFRDNLQRQGFVLGECMVSVDHGQDEAGDAWQRFASAWTNEQGAMRRRSLAEVPDNVMYLHAQQGSAAGRAQGIDLFA